MLFVPAIYFTILLIVILHKQGLSIAAYIIAMYAFTSAMAIFLYQIPDNGFTENFCGLHINPLPTLVYCAMPTLIILPFIHYNPQNIRNITCVNERLFNFLCYIFIGCFFFMLLFYAKDLIFRISMGSDIGELRGDQDVLAQGAQANATGLVRFISNICNSISSTSSVALLLFYYSICFLKRSKLFNALLFISSLSNILLGIIGIDRSMTIYWMLKFVLIYVMFRPYMAARTRKAIAVVSGVLFGLGLSYILLLTFSRFESRAYQSLLYYSGQSFLYFCWFWENYTPPVHNYGFLCPIISHFFIDWGYPVDAVPFGKFVEDKIGYFVNFFYSFMGSILFYLGKNWILPLSLFYYFITRIFTRTREQIDLFDSIIWFLFASVPLCGIFVYMLSEYINALGFVFILVYCLWARPKESKILTPCHTK